jgi:hypothetical protein
MVVGHVEFPFMAKSVVSGRVLARYQSRKYVNVKHILMGKVIPKLYPDVTPG